MHADLLAPKFWPDNFSTMFRYMNVSYVLDQFDRVRERCCTTLDSITVSPETMVLRLTGLLDCQMLLDATGTVGETVVKEIDSVFKLEITALPAAVEDLEKN